MTNGFAACGFGAPTRVMWKFFFLGSELIGAVFANTHQSSAVLLARPTNTGSTSQPDPGQLSGSR